MCAAGCKHCSPLQYLSIAHVDPFTSSCTCALRGMCASEIKLQCPLTGQLCNLKPVCTLAQSGRSRHLHVSSVAVSHANAMCCHRHPQNVVLHADEVRNDVRTGNDLLAQLGEGVTFYSGMQEHVNKLKQMCADYVMARKMDAERREQDLQRAKDTHASEDAARRMQQMDLSMSGPSHVHPHPYHHGGGPPGHQPPPPPPPAQHMYPQASGPTPGGQQGGAPPFSAYPSAHAPPAPPGWSQGPPPPGQQAHGPPQQQQHGQYGGGQQGYYQPHTYPQPRY